MGRHHSHTAICSCWSNIWINHRFHVVYHSALDQGYSPLRGLQTGGHLHWLTSSQAGRDIMLISMLWLMVFPATLDDTRTMFISKLQLQLLPGSSWRPERPSHCRWTCAGRRRGRRTSGLLRTAGTGRCPPPQCRGRGGGDPPVSRPRGCAGRPPRPPCWEQAEVVSIPGSGHTTTENWDSSLGDTQPTITPAVLPGKTPGKIFRQNMGLEFIVFVSLIICTETSGSQVWTSV